MSDKAFKDQEQQDAEAKVEEFRSDLGPFVVAAESTRMPMVFTDAAEADDPIIFANPADSRSDLAPVTGRPADRRRPAREPRASLYGLTNL